MGDEVLEESEFEPFFEQAEALTARAKIALFGSYDCRTGEWMENWCDRVKIAAHNCLKQVLQFI